MAERFEKRVSALSGLTRSEARGAIKLGRVTVNGEVVHDPSQSVALEAVLRLDDRELRPPPPLALFHKPVGVQCTVGDNLGRPSLAEAAAPLLALGLHPAGRLDADSSGLLPFCLEGALTQRFLHPRHGVEKTYLATVEGQPGEALVAALAAGVATAEGVHTARVESLDGDRITLTVTEGKHRMVRRMLYNAGFPVLSLHRLRFGALELGELAAGAWREATEAEAAWAASLR